MKGMKAASIFLCLALAQPVMAQDRADQDAPSLMERGMQMLLEGFLKEMEPALEELEGLAEEFGPALDAFTAQMGPALRDLLAQVEDWSVYAPPEMLENGDIIIRRKPDAPTPAKPVPDAGDQIDI